HVRFRGEAIGGVRLAKRPAALTFSGQPMVSSVTTGRRGRAQSKGEVGLVTSVAEKLSPDPYIGTLLDQEFRIEEKLGSGGMGCVYRAVQQVTERSVAIKVLHSEVCDTATITRFRQEAHIISRLSHPHIITVYKYGQHTDGTLY